MSSIKLFTIPDEFQPIQLGLQRSLCETIILTPSFIQPNITQSKLAGSPYVPKGELPIVDEQGQPMLLLAQINFAEIYAPKHFPRSGILQFFIVQNCYERYTAQQAASLFKIRYYPTIETHLPATNHLTTINMFHFPIEQEQLLFSQLQLEPVSATDYRLSHYVNPNFLMQSFTIGGPTLHELYMQYFLGAEHKIGGYPYFIEEDIRSLDPSLEKYDTLLFQLVSNDAQSIMWGDSGVISFFINEEKLKQLDFSDVLFYAEDY